MHGHECAIVWWRLICVIEKWRWVDGKRIISVKKDMQYEQDCCGCGVATIKTRVVMS